VPKVAGYDRVIRTINAYPGRWRAVARRVLEGQAAIIEARMKDERVWTDRTGNARANLRCRLFDDGRALKLRASHGVPYGPVLEHGHQGRYAILGPTVRSQWPVALKAVAAEVKAMKGA
jgi:hypothetical protein